TKPAEEYRAGDGEATGQPGQQRGGGRERGTGGVLGEDDDDHAMVGTDGTGGMQDSAVEYADRRDALRVRAGTRVVGDVAEPVPSLLRGPGLGERARDPE